MNRLVFLSILALLFCAPLNTFAWGMLGHRVVGGIAEHYLNPKARAAVKRILGNETLAMAASWADFIKSDRSYDYLGPWHFINVSSGKSYGQFMQYLQNDTATDLFTKMNLVTRELKSAKLSNEKRVFYLKLLIHLVGDAHQPMHVGRPDDRGGNDIRVSWFGRPTNLHRVWDEHLVEFQQLSYTEHIAAINFTTAAQREKWTRQPVKEWLYESYQAAGEIYMGVKADDKLRYDYNFKYADLMNEQLLKGGVRLAAVLNDIYGK